MRMNELTSGGLSRRSFLKVAGGGAAAANVLPNFIPLQGGAGPDYASAGQQYEDGWDTYPSPPAKSWTREAPGTGAVLNVLGQAFNPPATPFERNPAWQEVNKRLNANVHFTVVPIGDYPAKLGTTMAGNDLPDLMLFPGGLNVNTMQALYPEGFGQPWQDFWRRGLKNTPPYNFIPLPPFPAHDGGTAQHYLGPGFIATNAIKQGSPERIKEVLRILDYLASPFGSEEDLLLQYGLPEVHYTLDGAGKLTLNDRSNADANYVNWKYMMQHPQVMYVPDVPGYAKAEYDAEHVLIPAGVDDPTFGLYSPTLGSKGATLTRTILDGFTDVIAGRRPIADYDQIVKDWQASGGDQMRKELQDALAAAAR